MPYARLFGLAGLLIAELVVLMTRFSVESLEATGQRWWADTLWRWKIVLPPLAIAMSTAGVLLGGDRLRAEWRRVSTELAAPHRAWPYLVAHLASFAVFARLTVFLLEGDFATSTAKPFWVALWLALAAATAIFWAASLCAPALLAAVAWRARGLVAVGVIVGFMAWVAGLITEGFWDPLQQATMNLVAAMVHLIASDAVFVPDQLAVGTQRFWVQIASVCAGYEGIGLIWVFLSAYLVMYRDRLRFPHALLLIPIGTVAVWIANAIRLTALIAIGTWISPDIAMGGFHAYSGSILFCGVAIGLVWGARRTSIFDAVTAGDDGSDTAATEASRHNVTAAYLIPFLAIVATQMVAGAASTGAGFDVLYPARVVTAGAALVYFRRVYRDIRWTCSWEAVGVGVFVFVLWMALEPSPDPAKQAAFADALHALPPAVLALWLTARVVGSVVTVPIAEELAFRGYLHRRLIDAGFERVPLRTFTWTAFLVSSLLFGVMHGRWLAGTLAGMCYALVLYRRGELGDAIGAHAITNALIAIYVLATGHWLLW
jgi:exosortase E/protease (VPEID-CTERM system)